MARKKREPKKVALIDADILLYQAACAVEKEIDWGNDMWTLHSDAREGKMMMDNIRVAVRVRPPLEHERNCNSFEKLQVDHDQKLVK
jgi:hypothetical protein